MFEIKGKYTTAKVMIDKIDATADSQIHALVNHIAFDKPVAIMPDTHAGAGAVIGFTMELGNKIIPNIVGVDIGCGMLTFEMWDLLEGTLMSEALCKHLDEEIRRWIPTGTNVHTNKSFMYKMENEFPWKKVAEQGRLFTMAFNKKYGTKFPVPKYGKKWFQAKCSEIGMDIPRAIRSLGTLGGGNHFIEIGRCEKGKLWCTVHSGSRQFGQKIALYWQRVAAGKKRTKKEMAKIIKRIKETLPKEMWQKEISRAKNPKKNMVKGLEYLEGENMFGYLTDMVFAQAYAEENRKIMKDLMLMIFGQPLEQNEIECSHNYIDFRDFIIRKGATAAHKGQKIIIPFNMEDGTLICEGKGNPEWNYSAPHGAGRLMSRKKAKEAAAEKGLVETAKKRMAEKGIFASALPADELRNAYKNCAVIEKAIGPTAAIINRIKPIMAIKEGERK